MESLTPGVLLKLLRDMDASSDSDSPSPAPAPALLQVTSIIPALAGTDLFPDRGFYLRVSDSSHSTYVSLPQDHDDLILSDNLQLGQLIHVSRFDPASPVPILRGLHLLPTRLPCPTATTILGNPSSDFFPPPPRPDKKKRSPITSRACTPMYKSVPTSPVKGKRRGLERGGSDILSELAKISVTVEDEDSEDSDGSRVSCASSYSSPSCVLRAKSTRKSWNAGGRVKERRRDARPVGRSRSTSVSPKKHSHRSGFIPKDDTLAEILAKKKDAERNLKVLNGATKRNGCVSNSMENSCTRIPLSSCNEIKWPENNVVWASLPPSLVKYGKDVLRQRDLTLNAAADALQEAFASEKLLQSLSNYSELKSNIEGDPQQFVERFLNFYQDLAETRIVTHSLAKLGSTSVGPASVKTAAKVARERKKCAVLWIKAALESDFSRFPPPENSTNDPIDGKFLSPDIYCHRPKCSCIISKERKGSELLPKASDLADALLSESNRWFLKYIEKFLDAIQSESCLTGCGSQIASLLNLLKKVDDWLDSVSNKERAWASDRFKDGVSSEDEEAEACGRVRKKIYSLLLKHVESAASALESRDADGEEKDEVYLLQDEDFSDGLSM